MYIACKNCNTNFIVLTDQIGLNGRKVKCSKCGHIWHQKAMENSIDERIIPTKIDNLTDSPDFHTFDKGVNLPVTVAYKPKTYNLFTFILIAIIIFLSYLLFNT